MKTASPERVVPEIFAAADVVVNGSRAWDIQVHHDQFYKRLAAGGSMAMGESYMDGWWDCEALDQFFDRILRFRLDHQAKKSLKTLWCAVKAACTCSPGRFRAFAIGRRHYDMGNDLFSLQIHLPKFHAAIQPTDLIGSRKTAGLGGLAQLWPLLRSHPHGLISQFQGQLGPHQAS